LNDYRRTICVPCKSSNVTLARGARDRIVSRDKSTLPPSLRSLLRSLGYIRRRETYIIRHARGREGKRKIRSKENTRVAMFTEWLYKI